MTMLRRLLPLAFLLPLVLTGCDTAEEGENEFPLTSERPAGFTFEADALGSGDTFSGTDVESSNAIINDSRFGPSDVASARIESGSVEINLDFPFGANNEVFANTVTLTLSAQGVADQIVARGEGITLAINSTTAPQRLVLGVVDADITEFLQRETFTATLSMDVAEASGDDYQFTVTFDVGVTVNSGALTAVSNSY